MSELVYAIDYGTSNSLLAAVKDGVVLPPIPVDPLAEDPTVLKSVLYSPTLGNWYYGARAIDAYGEALAEGRIFRSVKKYLPETGFNGTAVHGRFFNLSELVAVFLRELKARADAHFGEESTSVVLGRPAAFSLDGEADKLAERRLEAAARLAGFKSVAFCPEPVAAAYEFRHRLTEPKTVLVADFGGGTSDFTVLRLSQSGFAEKDVYAIGGVPIAGDRFDGSIMRNMIAPHFGSEIIYKMPMGSVELRIPQHLINRLCNPADVSFLARNDVLGLLKDAQKWSIDAESAKRMDRLFVLVEEHLGYKVFRAIERTKIRLSDESSDTFRFQHPGIDLEEEIFAADFKSASHDLVERIAFSMDETIKKAGVTNAQIDLVCCTGGTAKLPALHHELVRRFGKEKLIQHRHFHAVALGLAERAKAISTGQA